MRKKITVAKLRAAERATKKLLEQHKKLVAKTTPVKKLLTQYVKENTDIIGVHAASGNTKNKSLLKWVVMQARHGYLGMDITLPRMTKIFDALGEEGFM